MDPAEVRALFVQTDPRPVQTVTEAQQEIRDLRKIIRLQAEIERDMKLMGVKSISELDRKTYSLDDSWASIPLFKAYSDGCGECRNTGYSGRTAILEIIPISPKVSDQLSKGEMTPYELEVKVAEEGILPNLRRSGLRLLKEGKTDIAAVSKVIDMTYTDA
jgi:type II secretory ATPase GspE/PulE/Tfp pilus assembly ATPase PilB-like protein